MGELNAAERSTVESIVRGVQRRDVSRRKAARSGWALLVSAVVALPVMASAMDDAISTTSALFRIAIALSLCAFVSSAVGSLIDNYQVQAALRTLEHALVTAQAADRETPNPTDGREEVTDAAHDQN